MPPRTEEQRAGIDDIIEQLDGIKLPPNATAADVQAAIAGIKLPAGVQVQFINLDDIMGSGVLAGSMTSMLGGIQGLLDSMQPPSISDMLDGLLPGEVPADIREMVDGLYVMHRDAMASLDIAAMIEVDRIAGRGMYRPWQQLVLNLMTDTRTKHMLVDPTIDTMAMLGLPKEEFIIVRGMEEINPILQEVLAGKHSQAVVEIALAATVCQREDIFDALGSQGLLAMLDVVETAELMAFRERAHKRMAEGCPGCPACQPERFNEGSNTVQ